MKWGPTGGILILVENGPRSGRWRGFLTFIQIAHGHNVISLKIPPKIFLVSELKTF
jgi:hypothetical protein